jgi:type IV secretory pathway VirB2 component (pilin)
VNDWSVIFLGVIAVSTLVMALIQIGAIIAALRAVRETQKVLTTVQELVQHDVRPLIAKATSIAEEASKTVTMATAQIHKVDTLVTDLTRRVDETAAIVQKAIVTPAKEGMAIFAAIRTGLGALRGMGDFRGRHGRHAEEDDPLFIG